ncbi:hypothetical protein Salat_2997600 [Sesamum alatum]|uniref:Uncharacterized protein n=1 Tax=Sesamum alatum TaxID=300844 RepID=A0AAE2C7K5_9LAMI|nr:hypothetical protein Salat_2997600 [Sesamum alatum]
MSFLYSDKKKFFRSDLSFILFNSADSISSTMKNFATTLYRLNEQPGKGIFFFFFPDYVSYHLYRTLSIHRRNGFLYFRKADLPFSFASLLQLLALQLAPVLRDMKALARTSLRRWLPLSTRRKRRETGFVSKTAKAATPPYFGGPLSAYAAPADLYRPLRAPHVTVLRPSFFLSHIHFSGWYQRTPLLLLMGSQRGRPVQETQDISKCHPVQHPKWGLFRHLRQVGIQGIRAFAYLKLALQPLALEKIHSSLQWRPRSGIAHRGSKTGVFYIVTLSFTRGEDRGQPLPEAKEKRQLDSIHARDTRDPNQR